MKKSSRTMIAGAAMAGLFTGSLAAHAHASSTFGKIAGTAVRQMDTAKGGCNGPNGCAGAKHDCAGKNGCKGQGGCKSGDQGCKGKNTCKGKGGCNTNKPM
jgi:hypothetical protein